MEGFYGRKPDGTGKLLPKGKKRLFQSLSANGVSLCFQKEVCEQLPRPKATPGARELSGFSKFRDFKVEDDITSVNLA